MTVNLAERVDTLEKLYAFERGVLNELVEALAEYAKQAEKEENFIAAAEQYEKLSDLQNREFWKQKVQGNILRSWQDTLGMVQEKLCSNDTEDSIYISWSNKHNETIETFYSYSKLNRPNNRHLVQLKSVSLLIFPVSTPTSFKFSPPKFLTDDLKQARHYTT